MCCAERPAGVCGASGCSPIRAPTEIARVVERLELDVVQLHGAVDAASRRRAATRRSTATIWPVVSRRRSDASRQQLGSVADAGDGVLLDAFVPGALGGTGVALPWSAISRRAAERSRRAGRSSSPAGCGRRTSPQAIAALAPDVVDVSSGVETRAGHQGSRSHARLPRRSLARLHSDMTTVVSTIDSARSADDTFPKRSFPRSTSSSAPTTRRASIRRSSPSSTRCSRPTSAGRRR